MAVKRELSPALNLACDRTANNNFRRPSDRRIAYRSIGGINYEDEINRFFHRFVAAARSYRNGPIKDVYDQLLREQLSGPCQQSRALQRTGARSRNRR